MIRVHRVCRRRFRESAFSGRGGLTAGGRWHSPGRRVIYTASSAALAALEILVHVDTEELPDDLVIVSASIPGEVPIGRIEARSLPRNWRAYPAPAALQEMGDRWLAERKTAVLAVPSAVIPDEINYLLNPLHLRFRDIAVDKGIPFALDPRLRRKPR